LALIVDSELGLNIVPGVFLWVQLCWGLSWETFEENFISWLGASWWSDQLNHSALFVLSAKHHTMGWVATKLLFLQVAQNNDCGLVHSLKWHESLKTRGDLADLTTTNVDLFAPKFVTIGMLPRLNDLADSNIHLTNVRHCVGLLGFLLVFGLLLLLGLVLFGLILFGLLGFLRLLLRFLLLLLLLLFWFSWFLAFFLCFFFFFGCRDFSHFFELSFGWPLSEFIWESNEQVTLSDQRLHTRQVLQVVEPSESMRQLKLLMVGKLGEMCGHMRKHDDISGSDRHATKEHSGLANVLVHVLG